MQFTLLDKWKLGLLSVMMSMIHFTVKFDLIFSFYKYLTSNLSKGKEGERKITILFSSITLNFKFKRVMLSPPVLKQKHAQ